MTRVHIVDPVCALPYGHNINALKYFFKYFEDNGLKPQAYSSRVLPSDLARGGIERYFSFLYADAIDVRPFLDPAERLLTNRMVSAADKLATTEGEMRRFLQRPDVSGEDRVFLPSADFYAVVGFIKAALNTKRDQVPKLYLRFIGVMERTAPGYEDPRGRVMAELRRYINKRPEAIFISAETPRLAQILAEELQVPVVVTPYPLAGDPKPLDQFGPLVILAAGASRFDKGYLRLKAIREGLANTVSPDHFEFLIQSPPPDVLTHAKDYSLDLFSQPFVHMMPSILSEEMLHECYSRSHVAILPYDAGTYYDRGSAVMQEAVSFGRIVIGEEGTGFATQISAYGIGLTASSDSDYVAQLARLVQLPRNELVEFVEAGRARYGAEVESAYKEWIGW